MTKITIPQIFEKYGKKVVDIHMNFVQNKKGNPLEYALDQILDSTNKKIERLRKFKSSNPKRRAEDLVNYTFLRNILREEISALNPLDLITLAIYKANPSAVYQADSSKIFNVTDFLKGHLSSRIDIAALSEKMKQLLQKQPGYLAEKNLKFRQPRLKFKYSLGPIAVSGFYSSLPHKMNHLLLFDYNETRNYLHNAGFATASFHPDGKKV